MDAVASEAGRSSGRRVALVAAAWLVTVLVGVPAALLAMLVVTWDSSPSLTETLVAFGVAGALLLPGPVTLARTTRSRPLRVSLLTGGCVVLGASAGWIGGA